MALGMEAAGSAGQLQWLTGSAHTGGVGRHFLGHCMTYFSPSVFFSQKLEESSSLAQTHSKWTVWNSYLTPCLLRCFPQAHCMLGLLWCLEMQK